MRYRIIVAAACAAPLLTAVLIPSTAQAAAPSSADSIQTLSASERDARLGPLRVVASGLDSVGRADMAGIYSDVVIDVAKDTVKLYVTDTAKGPALVAAAAARDPKLNPKLVTIAPASYTLTQLEAARDRIAPLGQELPAGVLSLAIATDGSGLELGVDNATLSATTGASWTADSAARTAAATAGDIAASSSVAVRIVQGTRLIQANERHNSTSPFYAGAWIQGSNGLQCSTSLPARNGPGQQFILTASHCGHTGVSFHTGAQTVGTVSDFYQPFDASIIPANSAAREWDCLPGTCTRNFVLTGTSNSLNGDLVCQDGFTSGVVCNIVVDNNNATISVCPDQGACFPANGVISHHTTSGPAAQLGDSGGLVFGVNGSIRDARGLVSAITSSNGMFFTQANAIFSHFGLHLTNLT